MKPEDAKPGVRVVFRADRDHVWEVESEPRVFSARPWQATPSRPMVSVHLWGEPARGRMAYVDEIELAPASMQRGPYAPRWRVSCTFGACTDFDHDHTNMTGGPLLCSACGEPTHYDDAVSEYRHDNPRSLPCPLTGPATARRQTLMTSEVTP